VKVKKIPGEAGEAWDRHYTVQLIESQIQTFQIWGLFDQGCDIIQVLWARMLKFNRVKCGKARPDLVAQIQVCNIFQVSGFPG
jgi:hypothetical protein